MNTPATFSLHMDGTRKVSWGYEEPKDLDLLYYTHREVTEEEKELIEKISSGNVTKIQAILSNYI